MQLSEHNSEEFYALHRDRLVATLSASFPDLDACASAVDEAMTRALSVARRQMKLRRHAAVSGSLPLNAVPPPSGETWLVVADLPQRQREAMVLRHLLGLTERGVAEAMGITRGTVSSTLRDAYQRLSRALQEDKREVKS